MGPGRWPPPRSDVSEHDDLIPIRMVESLAYCPRQAWYHFAAGEDALNEHMERGLGRHRTFAETETGDEAPPGYRRYRHLAVTAPELGVTGVLDELDIGEADIRITEYKTTRLTRQVWPGVRLQLAVQYLALREHAESSRWNAPPLPGRVQLRVYFADSRRYRSVRWDAKLEAEARSVVMQARAVMGMTVPPPGNVGPRCDNCQYEPACLPFITPIWSETR